MSLVRSTIALHVGAGAVWLLVSLAIAVRRQAGPTLLALQLAAALATLSAGIALWALLHSGAMGSREHLLVLGTLCAFLALGLQIGTAEPSLKGRLTKGALALAWIGTAALCLAATAMVGSRFVA